MSYGQKEEKLSDIIKVAKAEVSKLEKMLKKIDAFLCDAPEGCLKWQKKNGKTYYYKQYEKNDKWDRKYIKKDEISQAQLLAQKHYYIHAKGIVENQLDALRQFVKNYSNDELEHFYSQLSRERKCLVEPLCISVEDKVKKWEEEVYEHTTMYSQYLRFETEQGELVRSKSEVIIANILYQSKERLSYKYERPLEIMSEGKMKTIYPDFTIMNTVTGKIVYWEHAGRMDDPYYANDFIKKMNDYMANGFLPGRDVLLSFETQENPLDIGVVKKLVKRLTEI